MGNTDHDILERLFSSNALVVADPGEVFWYASGYAGFYYINTHYLLNGKKPAEKLLNLIDEKHGDEQRCAEEVVNDLQQQYNADGPFRLVTDYLVERVKPHLLQGVGAISGGERRDWFFSFLPAHLLKMPHLFLFKNGHAVLWREGAFFSPEATKKQLRDNPYAEYCHIVDLITKASSYTNAWIPFINNYGGKIKSSLAVVDRNEGGREILTQNGIVSESLVCINNDFFDQSFRQRLLLKEQWEQITQYINNPVPTMKAYLEANDGIIKRALAAPSSKIRERVRQCLHENYYGFSAEFVRACLSPD